MPGDPTRGRLPDEPIRCALALPHADFVMSNHRVHGTSVMPGVTLLDLVLRILEARGVDSASARLTDILFTEPIATVEGSDRRLRVTIASERDGVRAVAVKSRMLRGGVEHGDWRANLSASLSLHDRATRDDVLDVAGLKAAATTVRRMDEIYDQARREAIVHGPPMRCAGQLFECSGGLLAELELDPSAAAHAQGFRLHPAALDAATLVAFARTPLLDAPYIPIALAAFRAPRRLAGRCYVHVPRAEELAPSADLIHNDCRIHDADGRLVADLTRLACKRIRSPELISRLVESPASPAVSPAEGEERVVEALSDRIATIAATRLGIEPHALSRTAGFYEQGLDSIALLSIGRELEEALGEPLYPTLLFEFANVDSLARHLATEHGAAAGRAARESAAREVDARSDARPHEKPDELSAYRRVWVPRPLPAAPPRSGGAAILLVASDVDAGEATVEALRARGHAAQLMVRAAKGAPSGAGRVELSTDGLARAIDTLAGRERAPTAFAVLGDDPAGAHEALVALASALVARRPTQATALFFAAADEDPAHSAMGALARTMSAETPVLRMRAVTAAGAGPEQLATILADELRAQPDSPEVRYRAGRREVPVLTPVDLAGDAAAGLRRHGVYLIAGGSGGLGRVVASHLVERWAARLLLVGRSAPDDDLAERLEAWGEQVAYVRADVADRDATFEAVEQARLRFGRLHGVFHLAGVLDDSAYFASEPDRVDAVLAPKLRGAVNLDAATRDDRLELFVLFSSISAVLANPGQSGYAYANAFLDHFAARRSERAEGDGVTLSIGWPYWADGGMRLDAATIERARRETGLAPLDSATGVDALGPLLATGAPHVVVGYGDGERVALALGVDATPTVASRPSPAPAAAATVDVAVVGIAGRYPGARDVEALWQLLSEGRDAITEVPPERWTHEPLFAPEPGVPGKTYGRWGGFLDGVDRFAPAFFGISRREAEGMDPQERLFLTACWQALEDAGYVPERLTGERVGVFAGVMWSHYQLYAGPDGVAPTALHSAVPNRVSYCFDLDGPSIAVDTACSSSLVALHLAVRAICDGEATMALAGGVNATLHPQKYLQLAADRFLSVDGRCRAFGDGGTGYVPGEGVGVVVLKPLDRALADGDHVDAVIRGTAVSHNGRTGGYTVPDPASQAALIGEALRRSGVAADSISYVEAHGTGTSLGDPIEIEGLARALASGTARASACAIGSVKSNIGHLESAAGIAGLTKVLLQLRHRELVPSLHAETLNPKVELTSSPLRVQRTREPWRASATGDRLRAGVSAFGAGGCNAHVVVEEAPPPEPRARDDAPQLVVLSAPDAERLREHAGSILARLTGQETGAALHACRARAAQLLGVALEDVDPDAPLADLGLGATELAEVARTRCDGAPGWLPALDPDMSLLELTAGAASAAPETPALADIAFTLQAGRRPLAARLAVVVDGLGGLVAALRTFLDGGDLGRDGWHGIASGTSPEDVDPSEPLAAGDLRALGRAWVAGAAVDWPPREHGRRVRLPPTPLCEERCWVGDWARRTETEAGGDGPAVRLRVLPDGVALLAMHDEAHGNTLTDEMLGGLERSLADAADRDDVRAIVLTGTDRVFCTGGTPEALAELAHGESTFAEAAFVYEGLLRCAKPVVAAIRGRAAGGGLAFGLYADVVVLSREGSYSASFLKHGFTPGMGATFVLEHRLGATLAAEMMLTGADYAGAELERRGAPVLFATADAVLPLALDRARSMAALPPEALQALKAELARRTLDRLPEVVARELSMHDRVLGDGAAELVDRRFAVGAPIAAGNGASQAVAVATDGEAPLADDGDPALLRTIVETIERALCAQLFAEPFEIDHARSFGDMGLDSIAAVELVRDLNVAFGTDVDSVAIYDHPTVDALATHVLSVAARRRALHDAARYAQPVDASPPRGGAGKPIALAPPQVAAAATTPRPAPERVSRPDNPPRAVPIAVVGMAGRFPDAEDLDAWWEHLAAGRSAIRPVPSERWNGAGGPRWAALLEDVERFDHRFFHLSPLEAEEMDPQQRIFLTECWKALEVAGYAGQAGEGRRCGVFAGCARGDYERELTAAGRVDTATAFLGNSSSILASRIAYLLDLRGPSIAVDTACSSSLVAVHLACQSLAAEETDLALAGGVAVMLTPSLHVRSERVGMLSPSGTSSPFDARADGIVLGEGVGVVVLRRLDDALRDGDHVHGVIRGSGVNGDGRTNGITAPSAAAQARLLRDVHARAGISPRDISYVEAHGTGTALGDPIEFAALADVFGAGAGPSCGLGSVKGNVGHTTMAAGIAGLLKVLLALRHGELPPSAGFLAVNPRIDLDASPLRIVVERQPWPGGRARIATVSSFGFSGTNCHVVVSEATEPPRDHVMHGQPGWPAPVSAGTDAELGARRAWLVPVSARTDAELDAQLTRLADALAPEHDLADVAFTLATGRRHLAVRAAVVAANCAELKEKLSALARGSVPPGCARETAETAGRGAGTRIGPTELEDAAGDYVAGGEPDWVGMFGGRRCRRVPLPAYPFGGVRHRVTGQGGASVAHGASTDHRAVALYPRHPLVADHRLGDTPVLPGAATLQIVAEAARDRGMSPPLRLERVRWLRPFAVDAPRSLAVDLTPAAHGFEYRLGDDDAPHATGSVTSLSAADPPPRADPGEALARTVQAVDVDELYADFDRSGLRYGPAFRLLRALARGRGEAVGTLSERDGRREGDVTSLLDAGLQATAVLVDEAAPATLVPVGARTIELRATPAAASHVIAVDRGAAGYDVDLVDPTGAVLVRVVGLVLRPADMLAGKVYAPRWRELAPAPPAGEPASRRAAIAFAACAAPLARALHARLPDATLLELERPFDRQALAPDLDAVYVLATAGDGGGAPERDHSAASVLAIVRALIAGGDAERALTLKVVVDGAATAASDEVGRPSTAALIGLTRTVAAEHPRWRVACVDVGCRPSDVSAVAAAIEAEDCGERLVALRDGRRLARELAPLALTDPAAPPYREGGVYVLLGGAGGIGSELSLHLARVAHARLVWIGRRELDDEIRRRMAAVTELGGEVLYLRADAADREALVAAVAQARKRLGPVHGAFHTAAVLRDRMLSNTLHEDLERVLAPKARGLANLRAALQGDALDFLACFSSAASFVDSRGQGNYAAASTFEDALGVYLRRAEGVPVTVVNWGYWGSVGAVADDYHRARLAADGVGSIEPAIAMAAVDRALAASIEQVVVVEATPAGLAHLGIGAARAAAAGVAPSAAGPAGDASRPDAVAYARSIFAEVLRHPPDELDEHTTFEAFGVDSVVGSAIVERLQRDLGPLPSTLLFEEMTLDRLARRLARDHGDALPRPSAALAPVQAPDAAPARAPRGPASGAIAIVAVEGRYPQAPDLATFWSNLAAGRSSITEVPAERWDWRATASSTRDPAGYERWGGFLDGVDRFDAGLFGILPRDAVAIDPQERLFLETCWRLLEQAGYLGRSHEPATGVFAGLMYGTYGELGARVTADGEPTRAHSAYWSVANRVSYALDLTGPSFAVDSACSSSLTAVHLACESIRRGECRMAIAGGVNLVLHRSHLIDLGARNMLAGDGAVKVFDARADGYVPGEGVGAVLLKSLDAARADGDDVRAVVLGSTMNAGGKTSGYTVPNPNAQAELVAAALGRAGVDPRTITYVEAHGSGTALGDPIEIAGTGRALGGPGTRCAIGSVKSNIGHLEGAAGIAGLTKVLLQLRHEQLAPTVNLDETNPKIDFAAGRLVPQRSLAPWTRPRVDLGDGTTEHPLRAGVSSFGAGGANVHVVVEEGLPLEPRAAEAATTEAFVLSAPDRERLARHADAVAAWLDDDAPSDVRLADLASTSQLARREFGERLAVVAGDVRDLAAALREAAGGAPSDRVLRPAVGGEATEPPDLAYASRDVRALAQAWVDGVAIEWGRLWHERRPRRVPFPGIPLVRRRYWLDQREPARPGDRPRATRLRYERPVGEPAPLSDDAPPDTVRRVVVVGAGDALRRAIERRLDACGIGYVGEAALRGATGVDGVVHVADGTLSPDGFDEPASSAFDAAFELARDALRRDPGAKLRILCVRIAADDDEQPHLVALSAVLKTLALEHRVTGATVALARGDVSETAATIVDELRWIEGVEEVDHRGGVRRIKRMRGLEPPARRGDLIRAGATYLISGGAGALGLHVAKLLARRGAGEVVLLGRSSLTAARAARIEELGAGVSYVRADVTVADDVASVVADLRARGRAPAGVIHAAGVIRDAAALAKRPSDVAAVLGPKIEGALHLDRATAADPLDFFVMFSSIVGETGNRGQCDYAYANAFLDAFAATRERWRAAGARRGRTLSIAWPLWHEGAMTVDAATAARLERRWGMVPMSTENGLAAFEALLAGSAPVASVVEVLDDEVAREPQPDDRTDAARARQASGAAARPASGAGDRASDELVAAVARELQAVAAGFLLVDAGEVDVHAELPEVGFDSISMTELVEQVNAAYGLDLLPTVLFECVTLAQLAEHLTEHHGAAMHAAVGGRSPRGATSAPAVAGTVSPPPAAEDVEHAHIAVVGMAGKLPGSADLDELWRNLAAGRDLVRHVPEDREELLDDPRTRHVVGGFLDRVGDFDAEHFGISPREAALMDPQQRLFLEACELAVADAGYRARDLAATATGLFAGVSTSDYDDLLTTSGVAVEAHTATGVSHAVLANRVSHLLDLRGPSEAVDSACSSALVAVHRAVRALRGGECDMALAGGVGVTLTPGLFVAFAESGMLSPTGRCKTFDRDADGYVRGEGAGVVLLKPLARALADGDHVHAVIEGSAVNHGGRAASLTAPNPRAQAAVLAAAYADAGVDPATLSYVETHGTGTKLGDPIEIEGLKQLFAGVEDEGTVAIGSVKTNVGHLEAAAGIAGLLKVLLALRHGALPPHLHLEEMNPHVRLAGSPLFVNERLRPWVGPGRRAGVSSFGFGGTNAHVVVAAAPERAAAPGCAGPSVLVLSAPDAERLARYAKQIAARLDEVADEDLDDVLYTLQVGRDELPCRLAVVGAGRARIVAGLHAAVGGSRAEGVHRGTAAVGAALPGREDDGALAAAWVRGAQVRWDERWSGRPRRISLPTFELARTRHWFTDLAEVDSRSGRSPATPRAARATRPAEPSPSPPRREPEPAPPGPAPASPTGIAEAVRAELGDLLSMAPADIATDRPFRSLGLDSIFAMDLAERLRERHGLAVAAADLDAGDTVDALAARLGRSPAAAELLARTLTDIVGRPVDPSRGFDDEGLTSLDRLRVVAELETVLGPLPKTLLYDCPDVDSLAAALGELSADPTLGRLASIAAVADRPAPAASAGSVTVVAKRELDRRPELEATVARLRRSHGVESGLAGRDIAPLLLVDRDGAGYLEIAEHRSAALAWSYTGAEASRGALLDEFVGYARARNLSPNVLSPTALTELAGAPCAATPFGVVQTLDLRGFSLDGRRMRRLRASLSRFAQHAGPPHVVEIRPGHDATATRRLLALLDDWAAGKPAPSTWVRSLRERLRRGELGDEHRTFLAFAGDEPIAAVILTSMPAERGYLLDVELYGRDMPAGGLDATIVRLIELLRDEDVAVLSLGATFGVKVCSSPNASEPVERALEELRTAGMSGEGNYRFKRKFRPRELPIYLCQPLDAPTDASAIMLMIASPDDPAPAPRGQPPAPSRHATATREDQLAAAGWNPLRLRHGDVEVDLLTDSWAERADDWISARMQRVAERGGDHAEDEIAQPWLPFGYVVPTPSGRGAEALLCRALAGPKRVVLHNGAFPTWLASLAEHRFVPVALAGREPDPVLPGDVSLASLDAELARAGDDEVAFVVIELACNSGGGLPLSLANLEAVRARTAERGVALVVDATRIVGDALSIVERELAEPAEPWTIVHDLLALCDAATLSLSKEFGVSGGGLLASNLPALTAGLREDLARRGTDVSLRDRRLLQTALSDGDGVLALVRERRVAVAALRRPLVAAGMAGAGAGGEHCVLLDADRLPGAATLSRPVEAALAWMYEHAGIRGGPHLADRDAHPTLARCVRLAVPVGMPPDVAAAAGERLASLTHGATGPVDLLPEPGAPGRLHPQAARFRRRAASAGDQLAAGVGSPAARPSAARSNGNGRPVLAPWFERQLDELGGALQRSDYEPANQNLDVLREFQPSVECRMVAVDGGDVEVFTAGSGPPLVLMHPFNLGAGTFAAQMAGLADRFEVLVVHQPGVGRTSVERELSLDGVTALQRDVLSALGVASRVHVGGASVGAIFAQHFALSHPDRTRSLSLLGGSYKFANRKGRIDRLEQVVAEDFDSIAGGGSTARAGARRRITALLLRCESMDPRVGLRYIELFANEPDLTWRLEAISVPTLVVQGRHDSVVGVKTGHFLHGAIPDARYVELEDSGHFVCFTEPDAVNAALAEFLAAVDAATSAQSAPATPK